MLIVRDTRESGEMLQAAVAAGVSAAGGDALLGGVLPTPAAPLLIGRYGFDLAAVLSASHNPYQDNGIKFFAGDGYKLSDEAELAIERELERDEHARRQPAGRARRRSGACASCGARPRTTCASCTRRFAELDLGGLDVLLDCANGATYQVAPEIFRRLGANVTVVADAPGRAQHQRRLRLHPRRSAGRAGARGRTQRRLRLRRRRRPRAGGRPHGAGRRRRRADGAGGAAPARRGRLTGDGVAVTVMTNYGFHAAMERAGVGGGDHATSATATCWRSCARAAGCSGGEQSGHIIDMGFNRTGDGIAGALLTLEALAGRDLSERDAMAKLPQRLVNVRVRDRGALAEAREVVTRR